MHLGRLGRPVYLAHPVGAPVHREHRGPYLRHRVPAEMADGGQCEELLRVTAMGPDPHQPGSRRVVLELVAAGWVVGARLVDYENPVVAGSRHAGHLPGVGDPGDVVELDRRDQPLLVPRAHPGLAQHVDAAVGTRRAPDPGARRPGELPVLVFLGVLAEVPDVALVVLPEEGEFLLLQSALEELPVPRYDRAYVVDHLRQVGDGEHDAMPPRHPALDDRAPVDELGAGHEREHWVVDGERRGEPAGRLPGLGGLDGWRAPGRPGGPRLLSVTRASLPAPEQQRAREQGPGTTQGAGHGQWPGP